jgi:uncharacterized protein YbjT (DUF2867 family)
MVEKKNILILGATGPTGIITLRTALERGHNVTVFARNPKEVPSELASHSHLKVSPDFMYLIHAVHFSFRFRFI